MNAEALPLIRGDGSTSPGFVKDLKSNHAQAWRSLVKHYSSLVYAECRSNGLLPQEAADVTQDTFQTVFTLLPRFERRRRTGSFRRWLRLVTRNKIRDHRRRERNQVACEGGTAAYQQFLNACAAPCDLSSLRVTSLEPSTAVSQALCVCQHDFEPRTWRAFWRTAIDQCETTQVAEELEMTPQAVRKAKSRVLARLREELCRITGKPISGTGILG